MKSSRGERGAAIILSPPMIEAYQANNEEPLLASSPKDEIDSGRFISINIKLDIKFRQSKGAFKNKKVKKFIVTVTLASIYYPAHEDEHDKMLEFVDDNSTDWLKNSFLIISQNSNAQMGTCDPSNDNDVIKDKNIGLFGIEKKNDKGKALLNIIRTKD